MSIRVAFALCMVLGLVVVAPADLADSQVTMVEPSEAVPDYPAAAIDFVFLVECAPEATEGIGSIFVDFGYHLDPAEGTLWYNEIGPGWPDFDCSTDGNLAVWSGGFYGDTQIPVGQSTQIGAVGIPYSGFPSGLAELNWRLWGSGATWRYGTITLYTTPVRSESWGRIKALYTD